MISTLYYYYRKLQARQLNRDAFVIIEQAEQTFTDNRLKEIANDIEGHLKRIHHMFGDKTVDLRRAHYEFRKLHKEARRKNEQANLTTITLVIIHLRSKIVGANAIPALGEIDTFIAHYR